MIHPGDLPLHEMLKRHEGVRSKPYKDTAGKLTVGVGRNLDDVGLHPDEIDHLLRNDVACAFDAAERVCPTFPVLTPNRQRVLVSMAFNMGQEGLSKFKRMLAAIARSDWSEAADEMEDSAWFHQVGDRARELRDLMENG